jgi:DDE superfamily endonuclease
MPILPAELLNLIVVFRPLFTKPTWERAKVLLLGALLARGKRTVTACLRVVGLGDEQHFQNYHRVLNRAQWDPFKAAQILLGLLVLLLPADGALVIGADDTIERRNGEKIKELSCYRDAVRSTKKHLVKCFGLKWLSLMLVVKLPWSERVWALPFLTVLCRAQREGQPRKVSRYKNHRPGAIGKNRKRPAPRKFQASGAMARHHKSAIDVLMILIRVVSRWFPDRAKVLVVDGGYAAIKLVMTCQSLKNTTLVTRLPWDAALHHFPGKRPAGSHGPAPLKGARQRTLKQWAARSDTGWKEIEADWYRGEKKKMLVFSRTGLWRRPSYDPVAIRYVITRDPEGSLRDEVFACTDVNASPEQILQWVIQRWSVEVTFEEARAHLGMETQRQWSDLAISRTTPCLLGLFSLVVLLASKLQPDGKIPLLLTAWYQKTEATFSDCLSLTQKHLWQSVIPVKPAKKQGFISLVAQDWQHLLSCLSAAA